jgi:hypothetical protein
MAWLEKYDLVKTEKKQTCSFNLPAAWKAGNPLSSVEYMRNKNEPYVELKFFFNVIERPRLQQKFLAIWEKVTRVAESSDSTVFIGIIPKGEYIVTFSAEGGERVGSAIKLLTPFMDEAMKVVKATSA